MIIEVRMRDIPFEEWMKCAKPGIVRTPAQWEVAKRKVHHIQTPGHAPTPMGEFRCDGPLFEVVDGPPYGCVCPHIAEIGD